MDSDKKSNGALIGSIVIVIILIVGGIYLFKQAAVKQVTPEVNNDITDILTPEDTSSSTKIEAELNTIDLDSLDADL